jgi:hypothetical protein
MNFKRLLNTPLGRIFISIILGLGLATFFRKVCKDKNCIVFNGPILSDFEDKTYKYGNKCYSYKTNVGKCDSSSKKIIDIRAPPTEEEIERDKSTLPKILTGASAPAPASVPAPAPAPSSATFFQKMSSF